MTQNQPLRKIENSNNLDINIKVRTYSDRVLGYKIVLRNEEHYIINSAIPPSERWEVIDKLISLSEEYSEYGFILLLKDYKVFVDKQYRQSMMNYAYYAYYNEDGLYNYCAYKATKEHFKKHY